MSDSINPTKRNEFDPIKPVESDGFRPTPKRFMVWDKGLKKFYEDSNGIISGGGIGWLTEFLNSCGRPLELLEIVQSTNLFDKDGKEIFEGSIVKWLDSKTGIGLGEGIVRIQDGMTFIERPSYDLYPDWDEEKENLVLVGHILSNPELSGITTEAQKRIKEEIARLEDEFSKDLDRCAMRDDK